MASRVLRVEELDEEDRECVEAFITGNKAKAKHLLLNRHTRSPIITGTRFRWIESRSGICHWLLKKLGRLRFHLGGDSDSSEKSRDETDSSLLLLAAGWGWKDIVIHLLLEHDCGHDSCRIVDGDFRSPLHYSASGGHLDVVKYFLTEQNHVHDTMDGDCYGREPLQYACQNGHLDTVRYLVSEAGCNPSSRDNAGYTALHHACVGNHVDVVEYLLLTGLVNPLARVCALPGFSPVETPMSIATDNYDIVKLLKPFVVSSKAFPVHTYIKLILTGDSGAGKTTIAQLIILASSASSHNLIARLRRIWTRENTFAVSNVERFTAGIIPHHIKSTELGNFVVYDFAGQQEYFSSHAAILEQVMRRSAAIFLCMIDLSQCKEKLCESLHYWLSFIKNACITAEGISHVVIVGSHADQVSSSQEIDEKSLLLQEVATRRMQHQPACMYAGYVAMDCRHTNNDASRQLISILTNSHKAIAAGQPLINFCCHVLYAFLRKLNVIGCMLHELMADISNENDSSLPDDPAVLTELLTSLSDKGLILFINRKSSWVVVKTEVLLKDVNGTLFAPCHFKEHNCDLSSNTGIVPASALQKLFPQYNSDMLLGFLMSLDFCRPVHPSVLQFTNLQTMASHSADDLFFFPGLVLSERPDNLNWQDFCLQFGWCLGCRDPHQFFGSRFLHLLLLTVAYRFTLAARQNVTSSLQRFQRRCNVWKNGISWRDIDNITTVVELIDRNRWVLVAMLCNKDRPVEHAKLRNTLIGLVRFLHQERYSSLEVCECLVSPNLVKQYPFDVLPDTELFDIQDVAISILQKKPIIPSRNIGCIGHLPTQSIPFEPYNLIPPSSVYQLFDSRMADEPVPPSIIQQVHKHVNLPSKCPQTNKELREHLDSLSIFAGRNPLVSILITWLNVYCAADILLYSDVL